MLMYLLFLEPTKKITCFGVNSISVSVNIKSSKYLLFKIIIYLLVLDYLQYGRCLRLDVVL